VDGQGREAELLRFLIPRHVLHAACPALIGDVATRNKGRDIRSAVQGASSEKTMLHHRSGRPGRTSEPSIGTITSVLPPAGDRAMTHHPHVHMIVPGGGRASMDGQPFGSHASQKLPGWPVRVLFEAVRRFMMRGASGAQQPGRQAAVFFGSYAHSGPTPKHIGVFLDSASRKKAMFVYPSARSAGRKAVLAYLVTLQPTRRRISKPPPDRQSKAEAFTSRSRN